MMRAVHPAIVLAGELDELQISPTKLARQIGVPANRLTRIINNRRSVTGDTAVRLGHWFGISAQFWMNLQSNYEIKVAESKLGAALQKLPQRVA